MLMSNDITTGNRAPAGNGWSPPQSSQHQATIALSSPQKYPQGLCSRPIRCRSDSGGHHRWRHPRRHRHYSCPRVRARDPRRTDLLGRAPGSATAVHRDPVL